MKIAVIGAKGLPAKQGGIEHYCQELYPRMVAQGHSVDLFARSSYNGSPWLHNYDFKGVRVISLPSWKLRGLDALITSAIGAIACSGKHYDIVHFHALGPSLMSWLPQITSTAKVVVTCQGLDWQRAKWGKFSSQMLRMGEETAVRCADGIIVVSEELRSYFMQTYGRETVYIPNAPASYAETNSKFSYGTSLGLKQGGYILFLGRLVPEKRPDLLIQAFQALKPAGWKLVLAGGVSDTKSFTSQITSSANGNPDVVFAGEIHGKHLAEIVRGAGLFVLPSDVEGLPLAMLEAMREGVPVLASNIPPHQQLIAGELGVPTQSGLGTRGVLFEAGDLDSCVHSLHWAIDHPQELATMARKAQSYVHTKYNWEHITSETLKLYTALTTSVNTSSEQVKPIGSYLVEAGLLSQSQIDVALGEQKATGNRLGEVLVKRGWIKEETIEYFMQKVILPERAAAKRKPLFYAEPRQQNKAKFVA
jgi:glycosyltransferase involved in cell wall biosynthesis